MIQLLLSLLVILFSALTSPTKAPPAYSGKPPAMIIRPTEVRLDSPAHVVILGMPRGASDVRVVDGPTAWPTHAAAHHTYTVRLVPQTAGVWELDIRFRLHGHQYTVLGAVVTVR
jgi:hypothetical protein